MRNLIKKSKPTQAEYFLSESQRKNTSRLSFIYGSPRLVALITVLVLGSGIAGIAIVQKQRDSKAAVSQQTFSWNKGDWQTAMNRWTATGTPGFDQYAEVYKDGEAFAMSFKVGPNYPDGYDVCYSMPMVGIEGTQNVRFTEADFTYVTNEDSSTGVRVKVDGVDMPFTRVQDLPGGNRAVTANFTSVPGGGMQPGQTMSFCHYKRNGAGKITAPKRTVSVFAYSIRGSYEIFVPDAPTEPDRLNAGNNADAPAATPAPAPSTGGQAAPAPVTERAVGTPPAGSRVIDSNQWGRWGFPAIDPGATLPHGNNENLTITFNKGATYKNSVTPCWTTVIPNGYTATAFEPFVERNDAGKNTVFLRASNNPDEIFPSAGGKAIGNNKYWQFANPVGAGGTISVCSINNNGEKFESERNVKVTQYYIYGTGGTEGQQIDATPPTIDIISPANGATVSGNITIKARVSDNKGIRYIEFKNGGAPLDGKQLAPDTNFEQVIDTTKLPNGDFRIEPLAFDTDNNFSVNNDAKAITIKIQNANPNPPERLNAGNNADAPRNTPSGNTTTGSGSSGSSGSTPSQQTPPNTKPAAQPSPAECTTGASLAQAEDGKRSDNTAVANDPLQPDVKAAVLFANDSYVECTLTVPKDGFFGVGANLRSADFRGVAQAKLSMAGFGGAVTSRTITAPERQAYGLVRFEETAAARRNVTGQNEVGDYRYLTSGQKVVVRVTFVNDATDRKGGDRNLWVDYLTLVEVNPESATAAALASGDNKQTTVVVPSKPKVSRIEAEEASLHKGANVEQGSGKKFVRLYSNDQYIEYTLTAPAEGKYVLGAEVDSDNRLPWDRAEVRLSMAGNNKGVQEEALNAPASFDRVVMPASSARNMSEGEEVVVRVNVTNANDNVFTKVNLLVDSFELVKVTDSDVRPARQAAKPEKESVTTQQGTPGEEEISYSNNSGAVLIKVEAEKARSQGNVVDDQQASRGKAVQLAGKGSYVEYEINFPETDMYSLDFQGKSEDLDQRPSTARIILDGKKLFGNDEKLESNPSYAYYTSERKVFVEKGRHTFRVEFVNPGANDEGERALVVDYLKIRGMRQVGPISPPLASPGANFTAENPDPNSQIFQAENASLCQSSREKTICEDGAVSDYTAYGGRALTLNRKGDFVEAEFHVTTPGSYSVGASLRSLDYYGSAKADIFIDGDKVAGNVTPSTQGYKPSFMYTKTFKANTRHKIKVVYVNDLCGTKSEDCTLENDRNLLVDQLRVSLVNEEPSNNRVSQQLLRNTASAIREQ